MTSLTTFTTPCAVCEHPSQHTGVASTNAMGDADLDGRPPEMQRSTMEYWVQDCPGCGYAAEEITEMRDPRVREIVAAEAYQRLRRESGLPEGARKFERAAWIEEELEEFPRAFQRRLQSAWTCDDMKDAGAAAVACRREALRVAERAAEAGMLLAEDLLAQTAILADVARRAGDVARVARLCDGALGRARPMWRRVFEFQKARAAAGDRRGFSFGNVRPPPLLLAAFIEALRPRLERALGPGIELRASRTGDDAWTREILAEAITDVARASGHLFPPEQVALSLASPDRFHAIPFADPNSLGDALVRLCEDVRAAGTLPAKWSLVWTVRQHGADVQLFLVANGTPAQIEALGAEFAPFRSEGTPPAGSFFELLPDTGGWLEWAGHSPAPALVVAFQSAWALI